MSPSRSWLLWLAEGGGLGRLPLAPGTWGSAGAAVAFWLVHRGYPVWGGSFLVAVGLPLGFWACREALRVHAGSDPDRVVADEFVGQWIALLPLAAMTGTRAVTVGLALGFLVFRACDIFKVPPARRAEALPGPWGVLLDDVVAGIYTSLMLLAVRFYGFLG